jgi:hypothetical protein
MTAVALRTVLDIVFAAGLGVAALALTGATLRRAPGWLLASATAVEAAAAVTAWIVFAFEHGASLAVPAAGLSACALVAAASLQLRGVLLRLAAVDAHLAQAQSQLFQLVDHEAEARAAELERTLARARAESASLLEEQERRFAEERRRAFAEREVEAAAALSEKLTQTQAQVEQRLAAWAQDLDRAAEVTKARIAELAQRQRQQLSEVELRLAADAERLAAESEEQRAAIGRLRAELDRTLEETLSVARAEVETHAVERRRAMHELEERLGRRERELLEIVQREEAEATQSIRAGFQDVQRRQVEQMARVVERSVSSYADEAAQQFAALVKTAREDAAKRLARELDRSVSTFAREAEGVLAERLAHVGDAGAQQLERRLAQAAKELERQRDDWISGVDERVSELETDVRRRLEELVADAEAERAVLEARLQELVRRFDAAAAVRDS